MRRFYACPTARPSNAFVPALLRRTGAPRARPNGPPRSPVFRLSHDSPSGPRDGPDELAIRSIERCRFQWTDAWGEDARQTVTGNPVAFHAMRGLAAHSNGFQTIRALAVLMSLLGTIDRPGGFRHKAPYPRAVPPSAKPPNHSLEAVQAEYAARQRPARLASRLRKTCSSTTKGGPVRIDKAFSWEYPLAVHGLMHSVITNAWRGDPYPIDTLHDFHGQHGMEFVHEHDGESPRDAQRPSFGRRRRGAPGRIQNSVHRRVRCVPVGNDRITPT